MAIGPISTLILSHFFTKTDRFSVKKLTSVLVGLIGVLFIINFQTFFNLSSGNEIKLIAKLAVIIAAFGYMTSNIIAYNTLEKVNAVVITTFATLFGAIVSVPFMFFYEFSNPSQIDMTSFISILYLGLFPTAIAFQFRYYITKRSGPVFLSYVAYLIPAFAILWGYLILGEKINLNSSIGIVLVLAGVYIGQNKLMNEKT
jgi:drug/metabolite transporter (DMT)-like permease